MAFLVMHQLMYQCCRIELQRVRTALAVCSKYTVDNPQTSSCVQPNSTECCSIYYAKDVL